MELKLLVELDRDTRIHLYRGKETLLSLSFMLTQVAYHWSEGRGGGCQGRPPVQLLSFYIVFGINLAISFVTCKTISTVHAVFYFIVYLTELTHIGLSSVDSGLDSGLAGGVHVL